jgi:hypothetical protein
VICRLAPTVSTVEAAAIDALLAVAPNAHYSQHPGWARLLPRASDESWLVFTGSDRGAIAAAGMVRCRRVPFVGHTVVDLFRGPAARTAADWLDALDGLDRLLDARPTLALRIDAGWSGDGAGELRDGLARRGFVPMEGDVANHRTLEIDLTPPPDAILQSFHSTTRRHVRKALKLPIELREDLDDDGVARFAALYQAMSERKGAGFRSAAFLRALRDFCREFPERGFVLSAWMGGELLSAIVVFTIAGRAIYGYGASSGDDPQIPKSHLVHFAAMQRARDRGCRVYDFGGFSATAGNDEADGATEKVNFFKRGFGGRAIELSAPHERIYRPLRYRLMRAAQRGLRMIAR